MDCIHCTDNADDLINQCKVIATMEHKFTKEYVPRELLFCSWNCLLAYMLDDFIDNPRVIIHPELKTVIKVIHNLVMTR